MVIIKFKFVKDTWVFTYLIIDKLFVWFVFDKGVEETDNI